MDERIEIGDGQDISNSNKSVILGKRPTKSLRNRIDYLRRKKQKLDNRILVLDELPRIVNNDEVCHHALTKDSEAVEVSSTVVTVEKRARLALQKHEQYLRRKKQKLDTNLLARNQSIRNDNEGGPSNVDNIENCQQSPIGTDVDSRINEIQANINEYTQPPERMLIDDIPTVSHTLKPTSICHHCRAKLFQRESTNFCCGNGQISLAANSAPPTFIDLLTSSSKEAVDFRTYIRMYNNMFAFTSFGVKYDKELCRNNNCGIYTFRVQGQHEIENRMRVCDQLNPDTIQTIMSALRDNPYCSFFRSLSSVNGLENHTITIRSDAGLDQRVFNAPSASQVAAIWIDGDGSGFFNNRDIRVSSIPGVTHKVQYFFGCYDPLQYPLLFPYGDTGWHYGILRKEVPSTASIQRHPIQLAPERMTSVDELLQRESSVLRSEKKSRDIVSCREYYCFKSEMMRYRCCCIQPVLHNNI